MADDTPANVATHPLPTGVRLIVTVGVMAAVLLQVLDTTIANVALPHMQASLSATQDTINWVLTSYIVASAIALPISGLPGLPSNAIRTGTRCVTLTQLPLAFWAGMIANSLPVPAPML